MTRHFFQIVTLLLLSPIVLSQTAKNSTLEPYEDSDAYDVYASFLSTTSYGARNPLVISSETVFIGTCLDVQGKSTKLLSPAIADYEKKNEKTYRLQRNFDLKDPYELIPRETVHARFQQPGSGTAVEFSAVGFNAKKTIAVLSADFYCGGLCGGGTFYVFQKKNGRWERMSWKGRNCAIAS